jgi:hypothetical protein
MRKNIQTGDRVRVTKLSSDDGSCAHFVGQTGTVTGFVDATVIVKGFTHNPNQGYGFLPSEIEPA